MNNKVRYYRTCIAQAAQQKIMKYQVRLSLTLSKISKTKDNISPRKYFYLVWKVIPTPTIILKMYERFIKHNYLIILAHEKYHT